MQIPDLKSRACRSSWGLVLSRLTVQSEKNEVKQHLSGTAQTTERHLPPLSLIPYPLSLIPYPLTTFVTSEIFPSHTKTVQVFQRLSQHTGETLLAGTTVFRAPREGTGWWKSRHWADSGWARARFAIVLFPGQYCCWVFPGGICVLPDGVCKDLPEKTDPNCNILWIFGSVCCSWFCISISWKKRAVLKI